MTRVAEALPADERGSVATEFAIIAPVMTLLLLGGADIAHTLYMRTVLQGIVQKTARDSALETGTDTATQSVIDEKVRAQVKALANNSAVTFSRRFYRTFSTAAAARAEAFTDTNGNGRCDNGEPYQDENSNLTWDPDGGNAGQGGAKDKTLYTVSVSYPRFFPVWRIIGGTNTISIAASTILANQPYSDQGSYSTTVIVRNCP